MAGFKHFEKEKKPGHAMQAHATLRVHYEEKPKQRIEIGFRIPTEMEKYILLELLNKKTLRELARKKLAE